MLITRSFFQKIPFIRITSLFLIGILLNQYFRFDFRWVGLILTILISGSVILWHNSNFVAVKVHNLLVAAGVVVAGVFYPDKNPDRDLPSFSRRDYFLAEVCQKPSEKANSFQAVLLIQSPSMAKPEKLVAYFSKTRFDTSISAGDQLVILVKPQEIRNMGNPFEYDYQAVMRKNGIWFSAYLAEGTYLKTGHQINRTTYKAEQIRDRLISVLASALTEREERSVVSALTLGYRAEIDQETVDYFASTGAMHVLSVSGLHVGLIYFILGFLISFIKRGKAGLIVFSVVMIFFLWCYAFITGFSPSVQRATVMFTFVIIGNNLRRPVNIYNSLTASAFLLILLNPNVIFDIGFQLSYLAVFGIVLIQPALYQVLEITNPLLKWCWGLFTVSVAAQLTTFPLGLFYFNQFPNLFWLSGFVVIPLTTLIIWMTLAFFVLSPLQGLATFIGWAIQKVTSLMLYLLKEMDALPLAVSKGIVLSLPQVFVLFAGIVVIIIFISTKKTNWLFALLSLVLIFQVSEIRAKSRVFNQRMLYVYNAKELMVHLICGRTNYVIVNGKKSISPKELKMVERVKDHLKLDNPVWVERSDKNGFVSAELKISDQDIQFMNCRIKFISIANETRQSVEVLEITSCSSDQDQHKKQGTTIATGSSYFRTEQEIEIDHMIKKQGAYRLSLN